MGVANVLMTTAFALGSRISTEERATLKCLMGDQTRLELWDSLCQAETTQTAHAGPFLSIVDTGLQAHDQSAVTKDVTDSTACARSVTVLVNGGGLGRTEADLGPSYRLHVGVGFLVEGVTTILK